MKSNSASRMLETILQEKSKAAHYPNDPEAKLNGTLISCSKDLCEWMLHNLSIYHDSTNNFKGVITQDDLEKMWTTTRAIRNKRTSIGLGWWICGDDELGKYVFHVGNDPGFSATLMIFPPEDNSGIVILCNGMYPMDAVWNKIPFEIQRIIKAQYKNGL
jgi:CubicO group peptidase (beta-lactamase class C family)